MESAALPRSPIAWPAGWIARNQRAGPYALGGMVGTAALLVMLAAARPSSLSPPTWGGFDSWMVGPFTGLAGVWPQLPVLNSVVFSVIVAAMFVCWLVVLAALQTVGARMVVGAVVLLHVLFLLGPPLPLTDVFNYLNYARLGVEHGFNPYIEVPAALPGDPTYDFATWHHLLSPYGPLFTLFSYALVPLGVGSAYWGLKVVTVAAALGCIALVWRLAEQRGTDPVRAAVFVGLNPLVLVYGVGGMHNDFLMLLFVLLGTSAVLAQRPARAGAAMIAAAAIKGSAALTLPFALAGTVRGQRKRVVLGAAAAAAAMLGLSLAVFGFHGPGLDTQASLVTPLSPPNLLGLMLGQGGATGPVRVLVTVGLAVVLLALIRAAWRGADWVTVTGWAMLALVVSLSWEMPWYVLWVLPFAAVGNSRRLRRAAIVLTAFLLISLAPFTGWLLTHACHCNPVDTKTGQGNALEIHRHLR
ncbi:MAG: alpha,6-mannosyltransferase [Solirubrobacteraceae bacterium]|jgi:hypothetical protein|nr:alpha,6-mannosyltransferase [Solirubrobacteraceae bacterium]